MKVHEDLYVILRFFRSIRMLCCVVFTLRNTMAALSALLRSLRALPLTSKLSRNLIYGSFNSEVNFCTSQPRTNVIFNHTHEQALLIYKIVFISKIIPIWYISNKQKTLYLKAFIFSSISHNTTACAGRNNFGILKFDSSWNVYGK